jgi:hypothetical protein
LGIFSREFLQAGVKLEAADHSLHSSEYFSTMLEVSRIKLPRSLQTGISMLLPENLLTNQKRAITK